MQDAPLEELIEVSIDPTTGEASVRLEDVTGLELVAAAVVGLVILGALWLAWRRARRARYPRSRPREP